MSDKWRKYLFWFAYEHVNFRIAELESIVSLYHIEFRTIKRPDDHPYWLVLLPTEDVVHKIASRAVSLRFCLELWGHSTCLNVLHEQLKVCPEEWLSPYMGKDKSFKIVVETFCKHFTQKEKVEKIETFSYLPLEGRINLRNPDTTLFYIEHYGLDPNNIPDTPEELFFGRWVTDGKRDLIRKLSLKTRKFIGNTSMDPQLSLIMANQAQVKEGDIVLDPFVGSGSLLVAASQFGAYILGTDIDFLMLHARTRPSRITQKTRTEDESIAANMKQYGKESYYLDVVVSDFSRPLWKSDMRVDAIITDPPYGIREATERVGSAKLNPVIDEHQASSHIPSKVEYNLPQIYEDLLNFAAQHLRIGGKLVCWFPLYSCFYSTPRGVNISQLSLQKKILNVVGKKNVSQRNFGFQGPIFRRTITSTSVFNFDCKF
ncbi:tRNA (guanine(10)-N2)-methyltransferase homolog isoform X2 [Venturia canescens]|uniref:tRNA (guanine(10)-N2)-methyltransferase homolog isoform X2 n=1 Tax=Venturia canescens TaxID=32260 RepID=UPI001C9BF4D0|nr:tRNA (guanine(10)-N2)-methyltransferase homolog isoform X2 [Venturia canescens]